MPGSDPKVTRHARHLALTQVGEAGQAQINAGSALLIGVGGIGCAAASHLAASGVGHLALCDFDTVDASNLGRQTLYGPDDIGKPKAERAAAQLAAMNPDIDIAAINQRLTGAALAEAVAAVDVVLDGSDNFATRFQINEACVAVGTRLISGAAIRLEGQLAEFGPDYATSPCYRCLYQAADESLENCAGNGVLGPVPGTIGTIMAIEALKYLAGIDAKVGVLRLFDAMSGEMRAVTFPKRDDCPVCG